MNWKNFSEMTWPVPEPVDSDGVEWRLRYGNPSREDLLCAASVMSAYRALIFSTDRKRKEIVRKLKTNPPNKPSEE